MISKSKIDKRLEKKRNPFVVDTIKIAKKKGFLELAKKLSAPNSQYTKINMDKLNEIEKDKIIVVGKILGQGEINKKKEISALGFSEQAFEKLKKAGCDIKTIKEKIESIKDLEGVEII